MRRHFAEIVGVIFAASILLIFLLIGQGGTALLLAIGLGTAGVLGTIWQRRRELRRGRP
jgi:hypothetical protein